MGVCDQCGTEHDELEPGFRRPDAYFAVPPAERPTRIKESDDFVFIDDRAFFIRCVAPIPVVGRERSYDWGFWVKVSRAQVDEYRRYFKEDPPVDHPGFPATLANQCRWLRPTLGSPVHVHLMRGNSRPNLTLLDDQHELAMHQSRGASAALIAEWSHAVVHRQAINTEWPRKAPTLDVEGWLIARPEQVGRELHELKTRPQKGDLAKVAFVFRAADETGSITDRVEYMWVQLEEIRASGWWRGILDNHPFVPGPIDAGSPVWLRATDLLAFEPGEPSN